MQKFRDELLAFKQRAAEESCAKQQAKSDAAAERLAELRAIVIVTDPKELGKLKKDVLRQQLDIWHELLQETVIGKAKLKDMKNKPQMLKAILESNEQFTCHNLVHCAQTDLDGSNRCLYPGNNSTDTQAE
jgi:hypothetical protein